MAKKLTKSKAKEILHDKSVHGHPLTDKQRRFFGAIAGGAEPYKAQIGTMLTGFHPNLAENLSEVLSAPQKAATQLVTGKYQTPSEAMGIQNAAGAFLTDVVLDPLGLLGIGAAKKMGALDNAWKINPWRFKPDPEAGYRMIGGKEGLLDAIRSGEIRPTSQYEHAHFNIGQPLNPKRLSAEELIKAGSPGGYKGPYMAEMKQGVWQRMTDAFSDNPEMQEQLRLLGKDKDVWQHPFLGNIKVDDPRLKLYKEHWLKGYKQVKPPKKKQDGGWLDKYVPKAQNGIEGTMGGLTDKGFNFNPAWGGAWRDGGILQPPMAGADQTVPMAQTGTRQPIYTSDARDPRLRMYQDSLNLYNRYKFNDRFFITNKDLINTGGFWIADIHPLERKLTNKDKKEFLNSPNVDNLGYPTYEENTSNINVKGAKETIPLAKKSKIAPISSMSVLYGENSNYGGGILSRYYKYKKPVQPVEYRKRTLERPNLDVDIPEIEFEALPQPDAEYRSAAPIPRMISETPTKYSYTYPSGNEQKTIYFPSKSSWKAFTEQYDGLSTEERDGSFSAEPSTYSQLRRPNPAFSDLKFAMGGSLPGSVGFMYARTAGAAPSEGPYAKKTKASAQNGQEMSFYQQGLDWKPKNISRNGNWLDKFEEGGEIVKDNEGYWNPENWGKVVEIDSNDITMKGVNQPLIGVSDEGDVQYMEPGEDYKFKGKKVKEYPVGAQGVSINKADEYPLEKLDNLLNFTNYNKPKAKNGWLEKYK